MSFLFIDNVGYNLNTVYLKLETSSISSLMPESAQYKLQLLVDIDIITSFLRICWFLWNLNLSIIEVLIKDGEIWAHLTHKSPLDIELRPN